MTEREHGWSKRNTSSLDGKWNNYICYQIWLHLCDVPQGAEVGVRVNSVAPGPVDTPLLGGVTREHLAKIAEAAQLIGRVTQPEEVWVALHVCFAG